uniref:G protein-coupled receptor n=1 Tax=Steinernema glaseri TaxID=37863 RepID=A0A1I7ZCX1_9BILA
MLSAEFLSFELYTIVTIASASLFSVMFLFGSYVIFYKTPATLKAYKFYFIYLHTAYQVTIFLVGFFGRVDVYFNASGAVCPTFFGIIQLFDRTAAYVEVALAVFGLLNVGNAINLTFLYRYCHICRPNSFYATHQFWQKVIHIISSLVASTIFAPLMLLGIISYAEERESGSEGGVAMCFTLNNMFYGSLISIALYLCVTASASCFFIYRVIRTLQTSLIQASAKTREMQKALTITLLVFFAIPAAFGAVPVAGALYALLMRTAYIEIYFRFIFLACIWQGPLTICATMLLVKPYRHALLSFIRCNKKTITLFKITRSTVLG